MASILIIEDNEAIRENLEELLELEGYDLSTAENGEVGVAKFHESNPDLVICDVSMPVKNGYEVLEDLLPFLKEGNSKFMFLTASAQESQIAKGRASEADAYMVKPYDTEELLFVIKSMLK